MFHFRTPSCISQLLDMTTTQGKRHHGCTAGKLNVVLEFLLLLFRFVGSLPGHRLGFFSNDGIVVEIEDEWSLLSLVVLESSVGHMSLILPISRVWIWSLWNVRLTGSRQLGVRISRPCQNFDSWLGAMHSKLVVMALEQLWFYQTPSEIVGWRLSPGNCCQYMHLQDLIDCCTWMTCQIAESMEVVPCFTTSHLESGVPSLSMSKTE